MYWLAYYSNSGNQFMKYLYRGENRPTTYVNKCDGGYNYSGKLSKEHPINWSGLLFLNAAGKLH